MRGDIRSSGCGSIGDGKRGRQASLQFINRSITGKRAQKRRTAVSNAPLGKGSVSLPSIANCLVCSPFRTVFFKEIGEIAYEGHDCHDRRSGKPDEEQCFQKKYQKMQHDLGTTYFPNYAPKPLRTYKEFGKKSRLWQRRMPQRMWKQCSRNPGNSELNQNSELDQQCQVEAIFALAQIREEARN